MLSGTSKMFTLRNQKSLMSVNTVADFLTQSVTDKTMLREESAQLQINSKQNIRT